LNQRTSRGGGYGRDTGVIDLGHEPPLSVDGTEAAVIDRRRISVQWFSGTILTGLCGAALIGGAVFASLDGETTFARVPERVESALRGAFGKTPMGPWDGMSRFITQRYTEGPCALKIGEDWLIYFDAYRDKRYGALRTRDFKNFTDVSREMSFPPDHKHGTAFQVPRSILDRLAA